MATIKKNLISVNLWFDTQAEDAAKYYTSLFKNSRMGRITHFGKEGYEIHKKPTGSVMTVEFWIEDQQFIALNGGPEFKFNEAVSLVVNCDSQQEIDEYWEKLSQGGDKNAQQCGWLKDKFGLSWQVVPRALSDMLSSPNAEKTERVMKALLSMKKLDLTALQRAFGKETAGSKLKAADL